MSEEKRVIFQDETGARIDVAEAEDLLRRNGLIIRTSEEDEVDLIPISLTRTVRGLGSYRGLARLHRERGGGLGELLAEEKFEQGEQVAAISRLLSKAREFEHTRLAQRRRRVSERTGEEIDSPALDEDEEASAP